MIKYIVLQENQVANLRRTVNDLMAACQAILKNLDVAAGTLDLGDDIPYPRQTEHRTERPGRGRKKTGRLADVLFKHVPDQPFTPRQALESIGGYYQFTGKKNREIDSVRNALRTSGRFQQTTDGLFQKKG